MRTGVRPGARDAAHLVTAVLAVGLVAACSTPPPAGALPGMPPGVTAPDEYAFGDDVASRDLRASGPVYDALAQEVDDERLRNLPLVLEVDADVAAVRDAYDTELAGERGWSALADLPAADGAWTEGWISADGRDALVLVGLEPRAGETHVPLTVLTTLPDEVTGSS
ncbi:hypothetical protein [Promicromonospora sp. MEB111]|uniref:hypothetical protein n=1 Tax=Promicromonospora sp. MEB111 TaxID=3040301 RepID=UPI00254EEFF9|nr:hypothetical protein [Promicromonospora sp. MEB111]